MDSTIASLFYLEHAAHYFSSLYYHCEITAWSDGNENMMEVCAQWIDSISECLAPIYCSTASVLSSFTVCFQEVAPTLKDVAIASESSSFRGLGFSGIMWSTEVIIFKDWMSSSHKEHNRISHCTLNTCTHETGHVEPYSAAPNLWMAIRIAITALKSWEKDSKPTCSHFPCNVTLKGKIRNLVCVTRKKNGACLVSNTWLN